MGIHQEWLSDRQDGTKYRVRTTPETVDLQGFTDGFGWNESVSIYHEDIPRLISFLSVVACPASVNATPLPARKRGENVTVSRVATVKRSDGGKINVSTLNSSVRDAIKIERVWPEGFIEQAMCIDREDLGSLVVTLASFVPGATVRAVPAEARKANAPELHEDPPAPTTSPDLESGLSLLTHAKADLRTPRVVYLCGSHRFVNEYLRANITESIAGHIVISSAGVPLDSKDQDTKAKIEALRFRKIELADEILALNVGGYIGESTRRELEYAIKLRKRVRFLEANKAAG